MASIEEAAENIKDIVIDTPPKEEIKEVAPAPVKEEKTEAQPDPMAFTKNPKDIVIKDLLDAGLHFGHQTKRWNPKMRRYIFDKRNGIHIVDLSKSLAMLQEALEYLYDVIASGRSILLVGTKKQAQQIIKDAAIKLEQHYVTHRWLGGTLTNNKTIRKSIERMLEIEELQKTDEVASHKKEASRLRREHEKLSRNLGGIVEMRETPGVMFVVDINRESIAIKEANKMNIPVIAIVDTNCDPDPIDFVIPGNDDSIRTINLLVAAISKTIEKAQKEYAKVAAELAKKKEAERAAREAKAKAKAEDKKKKIAKAKAEDKKKKVAKAKAEDKPKTEKKETKAKAEDKPKTEKKETKAKAEDKPKAEKKETKKPAEKKAEKPAKKAEEKKDSKKTTTKKEEK